MQLFVRGSETGGGWGRLLLCRSISRLHPSLHASNSSRRFCSQQTERSLFANCAPCPSILTSFSSPSLPPLEGIGLKGVRFPRSESQTKEGVEASVGCFDWSFWCQTAAGLQLRAAAAERWCRCFPSWC